MVLSSGTYVQSVPIEVPPFHGLEPKLSISYSSQGGNGFAGVGWSLSGFSVIDAPGVASPGPYLLDGQPLVACVGGSVSPSCTTGGTHSTKVESYLKIKFDSTANTWTVWGKDGTKTVFSPTLVNGTYTVRWGQTSTIDTYGNTVTYGWQLQGTDFYPNSVSYNGYVVSIFRESRPDAISYAPAWGLRLTAHRLRSVIVLLGSTPIRGYKLAYTTSAVTGRSLVASIQQYGKDLSHTSGAISSGTSLPAQTFTYQADAIGQTFASAAAEPATPSNTVEPVTWTNRDAVYAVGASGNSLHKSTGSNAFDAGASSTRGIVSGDGYMQFVHGAYYGYKMAGLANNDSGTSYTDIDFAIYEQGDIFSVYESGLFKAGPWSVSVGDVFRVEVSGGQVKYRRNGTLLYTSLTAPVYPLSVDTSISSAGADIYDVSISGAMGYTANWCGTSPLITGDFNGDGRTDQLCQSPSSSGQSMRVRLATANGFAAPTVWYTGPYYVPFLGDFNGDGKTDLATYAADSSGNFGVALSTGSSFPAPTFWGHTGQVYYDDAGHSALCNGYSFVGVGDFNGDGSADVFCKRDPSLDHNVFVGISNGASGFSFSIWLNTNCNGALGAADFTGDGRSDLYCINTSGQINVYFSNGGAFPNSTYLPQTFCAAADYVPADLNGDGKTDLACKGNGNVALADGLNFVEQGAFGAWCTTGTVIAGDFDGDGKAEVGCNAAGNAVTVRKWQGTNLAAAQTWAPNWCGSGTTTGDFDGDGKTDLFCPSSANPVAYAGTSGVRADLVTLAANGLGGTSQVSYVPTTNFPNTNNPGSSPVATSVTIGDGRGGLSTTTYTYAGGAFNRSNHVPLGFASATAHLPCVTGESTCPSIETAFKQDVASAKKLSVVVQRDQLGRALTQKTFTYTTNISGLPWTSLLSGEWTYTFDGSGGACPSYPCAFGKRTLQSYQYDAYGNVTRKDFSGDYDATADESIVTFSYRPNMSSYIVDRIAEQKNYGATLAALAKSQAFWYDGQSGTELPPIKGSVTKSLDWLNTESRWVMTSLAYDSFGNLTTTTDATARVITTSFDPTYHAFPISKTNGAAESEATTWDLVCAVPSSRTDVGGRTTTMQTDALCRPITTTGPLGTFAVRSYLEFGTATSQRVRQEAPSATPEDGTGNDYALEYFDGLGRTYHTIKKGPSPTQDIIADTTYDARGQVASRTAPYYPADPKQTTTYTYDALGRLRVTTHPDEHFVSQTYGIWASEVADEHSPPHITGSTADAYGRQVISTQHLDGQTLETHSTYDSMGRLVGVTDPVGNAWSWTHDWLGRNVLRTDPNAGILSAEYDDAGRITAQIDAKGQRTDVTYDVVGRLATKVNSAGTVSITRSEPRAGYVNTGLITTMSSPGTVVKTDYDALSRPVNQVRTVDGVEYAAQVRYDAGGRIRGITFPDGDAVGTVPDPLVYDSAGRLRAIPGVTSEILYDAAGRATQKNNLNGTATTWTFSTQRGFLTHISTTGLTPIQDLGYSLDEAGLSTDVSSSFANEGWHYAYDELHRLTEATNTSDPAQSQMFAYDVLGNITSNSRIGTYSYPSPGSPRPHAPMNVGADAMSYDANGNLTAGRGRSIQWDADNRPIQINTSLFTYDGTGSRVKKTSPGSVSVYPFGDDYEVTNGVITKYIASDGLGMVAKRVGAQTFWIHTDRLGSIQAITDVTGADIQHRTYRPYGEQIAETSPHTEARGYIGERHDEDTGLTYLHARYYDPALGMFISPDPAHADLNSYRYGSSNPTNGVDPSGLDDCPAPTNNSATVCAPDTGGYPGSPLVGPPTWLIQQWLCSTMPMACGGYNGGTQSPGSGTTTTPTPVPTPQPTPTPPSGCEQDYTQCIHGPNGPGDPDLNGDGTISPAETKITLSNCTEANGCLMTSVVSVGPMGELAERFSLKVSQKGLDVVERHLAQFGDVKENTAMINRLRGALDSGLRITGPDANFYLHELSEATLMAQGLSPEAAHAAAFARYGMSPMAVFHPEIVAAYPDVFSEAWRAFWGIGH